MIHPSYSELMEAISDDQNQEDGASASISRYSLVMATSKRARQIVDEDKMMSDIERGRKPLSIAVDEFYSGKVRILPESEDVEEEQDDPASAETGEAQEIL